MNLYKTALQNLEAARKLIRPYKRWTVGELAVKIRLDKNWGDELVACNPKNKHAEAFCALGAVKAVNGPGEKKAANLLRIAALQIAIKEGEAETGERPLNNHIFDLNDFAQNKKNHRRVLDLFARAIRLAKKAK